MQFPDNKGKKSNQKRGGKSLDSKDKKNFDKGRKSESSTSASGKSFSKGKKSFVKSDDKKGYKGYAKEDKSEKVFKRKFPTDKESTYKPKGSLKGKIKYKKKNVPVSKLDNDGKIRLNRFIANAGICSRREADRLIEIGEIFVNGNIITELGSKIDPSKDVVHYGQELVKGEKKQYVLLNKPKNYITTSDDPRKRQTVMDLVGSACKERIYPVGRLDRQTTGVLLLTNDGDLTKKLTHPSSKVKKLYHVFLDKNVTKAHLIKMVEGVELEDGVVSADKAMFVEGASSKREIGMELHSGKNRVIRRMMEALGYEVVRLDRVMFAGLTKKNLSRGQWRFLSEKEVGLLQRIHSKA